MASQGPVAVSIGNFDGVHVGHVSLLRAARDRVGPEGRVVAIAFHPHPASLIVGREAPAAMTTLDERAALLRAAGADEVVRLEPTRQLLSMSPHAFVEALVDRFSPAVVVEGPDFRFGRGRLGDVSFLRAVGKVSGFELAVVPPVDVTLIDHTIVRASSTIARWLIAHGRVSDARAVLGRPYRLCGVVARGDRRGRTIGFPTANLQTQNMLPADGVYAAIAHLSHGAVCPAAVNVGTRPTVDGSRRTVEAHLIDIPTMRGAGWQPVPGQPEYGWGLELDLVAWMRDQVRFAGLDALTDQIRRDVERVRRIVNSPLGAIA